ncbi:MAG: hypothetical protein K0R68_2887 [Mycobacterium sp.]|nr:hypothetical protein [Mycobacterium sp.]
MGTDADDVEETPEDEAVVEAGAVAGGDLVIEPADEEQLIDEDHDPVDNDDLESLRDGAAVLAAQGPTSEQQEELDVPDAKADVDEQAAGEEEAGAEEAGDGEEETSTDEAPASDYVIVTTPPPASAQTPGSRLSRLLRRRR